MGTVDSNGPNVKVRGSAMQVCEKYQSLAREAMRTGNRVAAENLMQHAEHYYRVLSANGAIRQGSGPRPRHGGDPAVSDVSPSGNAKDQVIVATDAPGDPGQAAAPDRVPDAQHPRKPARRRPIAAKSEGVNKVEPAADPAEEPDSDHAA